MAAALRAGRISAADFPLAAARLAAAWNAAEDAQLIGEPPRSSPAAAGARRSGRAGSAVAAWAAAQSEGGGSAAARNAAADVAGERQGVEDARCERRAEGVKWQWVTARASSLAVGGEWANGWRYVARGPRVEPLPAHSGPLSSCLSPLRRIHSPLSSLRPFPTPK
ncbi:unnamed protein product [Closterium sp. NIES-65]|nr:unnamed protein product [Closterium sp. NIES-65]